jgi:hypothetical protein
MAAILEAPVVYDAACVSFCDRATLCHRRALTRGDARALGEDVARFLGETSLHRALELLGGARPRGIAEEDLVRRMGAAWRE